MPVAFPIAQADLGDLLPIQSVSWQLSRQQEVSGLGTGEMIVADLGAQLWEGEVGLRPLLHSDARAIMAKLDTMDGGLQSMFLANPLGWWPKLDPKGTAYGSAEPVILTIDANRKELRFDNLPAGYRLSGGDMFAVTYGGGRRGLYRLVGDVTANGAGVSALVEVRPHLRPGIVTALDVTFARPAAKVKLLPGSVSSQMHSPHRTRITFRVRQTLAAG